VTALANASNKPLSAVAARDNFAELMNRAAFGKERVVLARRGKPLAAIVPIEDVKALEALEDERDVLEARKRLADWERRGRPGITIEDYMRTRGIKAPRRKK
jgi:prevent-host-death family protein